MSEVVRKRELVRVDQSNQARVVQGSGLIRELLGSSYGRTRKHQLVLIGKVATTTKQLAASGSRSGTSFFLNILQQ